MAEVEVRIIKLHVGLGDTVPLPKRMSANAAGFDLAAAVDGPITLVQGQHACIPCGFAMQLPVGYEAQIRPRSGLAMRYAVTCLNSPGTIDPDYRGEVCVLLINHGAAPFVVTQGMRIAQMVVVPLVQAYTTLVAELDVSARGDGGFGSTGY